MTFEEFESWLKDALKEHESKLVDNIGDNYYWEYWSIEKLSNGNLKVGFDVGSLSGWILGQTEYKEVTFKQLYDLFEAQKDLGEFDALDLLARRYESLDVPVVEEWHEDI